MSSTISAGIRLVRSLVFLSVVCCGVAQAAQARIARLDLGGSWQLIKEGDPVPAPAIVPGCVHTDLLAVGKIRDPFYRDNETHVQWVGEANWIYRRSFETAPEMLAKEHVLLRCDGLDTLATVTLNGTELGKTDNMFRTYEFDVKKLLKLGKNTIEVKFDSVLPYIRVKAAKRKLPQWIYPGSGYIRKEPCNFGWDWGPTLITCGIWRPIGIVAFDQARLDDVLILQDHTQKGQVKLDVQTAATPTAAVSLKAKTTVSLDRQQVGSATTALSSGQGKAEITVANPKLWWPAGMGDQPLYTVTVDLLDDAGKVLDSFSKRIGLRTLRAFEKQGKVPMHFEVNGIPYFAKGANWIPADPFPNRVTKEKLRQYVKDAVDANMNSIRFWGGGYYEDDAMLDACDEAGLVVWADLKFACSSYPVFDDAFLENIKREVEDNVKRMRHHACIGLWCGNNEVALLVTENKDGTYSDEWTPTSMGRADYLRLFRGALGGQVRKFAPQTDYVTGSPDCGDVHYWNVWHGGRPFEAYRRVHGFMSEFGFQGFPEPKTVAAFTAPEDRTSVYSPMMKYHERSDRNNVTSREDGTKGTDKLMALVNRYFREPKDFVSTLWLGQITQGYGIKYGAEGWRREMPKSSGCVYWQYNDIWPGTSWSSVDYFGRWKALHYMAKRFYEPVLVSGAENVRQGTVDVYVTSDRVDGCKGKLTWIVSDVAGKTLKEGALDVDIPAQKSRKVETLYLADQIKASGENNVLVWLKLDVDGKTVSDNMVSFAYPKAMDLLEPKLSASVTEAPGGSGKFTVKLSAEHPALWAWLELDGVDARCSQNFVHVTQFAPAEVVVRPATPLTKEAFQKALRVRSVYDTYAH